MTIEHGATVERYLDFWNAATAEEQRRLAAATFTDDISYVAPVGLLTGPEALIDFHDQFTGHVGEARFTSREEPTEHHDHIRLKWRIEAGGKESFATGTDVLSVGPDGRVGSVVAFLDQPPEGFNHDH